MSCLWINHLEAIRRACVRYHCGADAQCRQLCDVWRRNPVRNSSYWMLITEPLGVKAQLVWRQHHEALGQTDRQTDRYRAMSNAGMTTVWPPQQPLTKRTYQVVTTGLDGTPASAELLPPPSMMHPHTHNGNILPGVQREKIQGMSMAATITHQGPALLVWLHPPRAKVPPPPPPCVW